MSLFKLCNRMRRCRVISKRRKPSVVAADWDRWLGHEAVLCASALRITAHSSLWTANTFHHGPIRLHKTTNLSSQRSLSITRFRYSLSARNSIIYFERLFQEFIPSFSVVKGCQEMRCRLMLIIFSIKPNVVAATNASLLHFVFLQCNFHLLFFSYHTETAIPKTQ